MHKILRKRNFTDFFTDVQFIQKLWYQQISIKIIWNKNSLTFLKSLNANACMLNTKGYIKLEKID